MADKVEKPANPMKFPYTYSAKLAQFPFKFYIQNQWMWRYYVFGFFCSLPVFYKINKLANSPENKKAWAAQKAKEAAAEHH